MQKVDVGKSHGPTNNNFLNLDRFSRIPKLQEVAGILNLNIQILTIL